MADDLHAVWSAPTTDSRLKRRIVRTVIQEVIADIDADARMIVLRPLDGRALELHLPRRRRGRNSTASDIVIAIQQLILVANDDLIAGILNWNKLPTGRPSHRWIRQIRERVTLLRSHHKIPVHRSADDGIEPWLNLSRAAAHLGVNAKTLCFAAESAEIQTLYTLPEVLGSSARATL